MTIDKKPRHFTFEERKVVEKYYRKKTCTAIAGMLGRSVTSVLYELKRSEGGPYNAIRAQKDADYKKHQPKRKPDGGSPRKYTRKDEAIDGTIGDPVGYNKCLSDLRANVTKSEDTLWKKMKTLVGL